jgi:hypothetical protein
MAYLKVDDDDDDDDDLAIGLVSDGTAECILWKYCVRICNGS